MFSCVRCVTDLPELAWQDPPPTGVRDNGTGGSVKQWHLDQMFWPERKAYIEIAPEPLLCCTARLHSHQTWSDPDKHSLEKLDLAGNVEKCKPLHAETIKSLAIRLRDELVTFFFKLMNGSSNFIVLIIDEDVDFLNPLPSFFCNVAPMRISQLTALYCIKCQKQHW